MVKLLPTKRKLLAFLLLLAMTPAAIAQTTVKGTVIADDDGLPMIGATVIAEGTNKGTVTNIDGEYTLEVPAGVNNIVFSYTGYQKQTHSVAPIINVTMKPIAEMLNEVVVTAMAVERQKRSLGYAVQDVKADELTQGATQNVAKALQGKVAGVQITQAGGNLGAGQRISIRGNSSFGSNEPLIVVDGVPINNNTTTISNSADAGFIDAGNGLSDINPEDIESISVLKGGSAAIYGMRAGNGVILITTKKGKSKKDDGKMKITYDGSLTFDRIYNLPNYQDKYGQGSMGSEYDYKQLLNSGFFEEDNVSYQDFVVGNWHTRDENGNLIDGSTLGMGYKYVDGRGGGINDGYDESWGPRLDIGLKIPQYNSPIVNGVRQATDWISHPDNIKDFFQTGISQSHLFAISNSGEKGYYRASAGYTGQTGTTPNTELERYTANISGNYIFNKYLSVDASLNYTHTESDNLVHNNYSFLNPLESIMQWFGRQVDIEDLKRNYTKYDENGDPYNWMQAYHLNPYYNLYNNTNSLDRDRLISKGSVWVTPTDWLKIEGRVGYDMYHNTMFSKTLETSDQPNGSLNYFTKSNHELNADLIAYLNHNFGEWNLSGLVGANLYNLQAETTGIEAGENGLSVPGLYTLTNIKGIPYLSMGHNSIRSNSVYANATAGWKNQVFLEASIRNDWHSTLNTPFFYPSISGSWVLTETFSNWRSDNFNYLKLRLNWANVGNATNAYTTGNYYQNYSTSVNGVNRFRISNTIPNINLRPENVNTSEIGIEAAFWDNRIRLDMAAYYKTTTDEIMSIEIARSSGFSYMLINAGEVRNVGAEISLGIDILQNRDGWNWTSHINWSRDKSTIVDLYDGLDKYMLSQTWIASTYAIVGKSWGTLMGTGFIYNERGEAIVDENGFPLFESGKELADIMPEWALNWNNEISYKNLSLGFLLDFSYGGSFYSVTHMFGAQNGLFDFTAEGDLRENGAVFGKNICKDITFVNADGTPNTKVVDPESAFKYYYNITEMNIINASYLKLREMYISYRLPKSWLKKLHVIDEAKVSIVGSNLAILWLHKSNISHIDPESMMNTGNKGVGLEDTSCPPTRSIGIKLNLIF